MLAEIYGYLRSRAECTRIITAGESAGAYIVSLTARTGAQADGYLFLGGFLRQGGGDLRIQFRSLAETYGGVAGACNVGARNSHLERELAFGRRWLDMFAAARAGKSKFEVVDGNYRQPADLARRRDEIDYPPDEMYPYIQRPALAGTRDLNVAPHHAACATAVMQRTSPLARYKSKDPGRAENGWF